MARQAGPLQDRYDHPGRQEAHDRNDEYPGNQEIEDPELRAVRPSENVQILGHGYEASRIRVLRQRPAWKAQNS